jgi:hypothetical protein
MPSTLVFPDGVRLALKDEIPGSQSERSSAWARIQAAKIAPGFIVKALDDHRFSRYAEINVDAPHIWSVFIDLCHGLLLGPNATLIASEVDGELRSLGSASAPLLISVLERHRYQLVNDGFLRFGIYTDEDGSIAEVVIAPTKHFEVWFSDETRFRSIMTEHALSEDNQIEFLDQYPHMTVPLQSEAVIFSNVDDLMEHLGDEVEVLSTVDAPNTH